MTSIRLVRLAPLLAVSSIALVACGGGSSTSELNSAVKEAIVSAAAESDSAFEVSDKEGQCIADKVLDDKDAAIALEAANAAGKKGQDMLDSVDSDNPLFARTVFLCLEVEKIVQAFSSGMTPDGTLTDEQNTCLVAAFKKIDKADLADALVSAGETADSTNTDAQAVIKQLTADITACTGVPAG